MATQSARITEGGVDRDALEYKVKDMYRRVAEEPHGDFHFALGRSLTEQLGYGTDELDAIPAQAVDSFAGVGCPMDLAGIRPGDTVLDLGSGSGTDTFIAALRAGGTGQVHGLDMTDAQRSKAAKLAQDAGFKTVSFHAGYIEEIPFPDASIDVVISNGVINLSADKPTVFREIARVLRPGGHMAISDIVTEERLPPNVKCDATLWAACIGGAMQQEDYQDLITAAGLEVTLARPNPRYRFLTEAALGASRSYGVKSITLAARKPE